MSFINDDVPKRASITDAADITTDSSMGIEMHWADSMNVCGLVGGCGCARRERTHSLRKRRQRVALVCFVKLEKQHERERERGAEKQEKVCMC